MPKDSDGCPYQPFPKLVETFKGVVIEKISCGKAHSLALDNSGSLFTWGAGACGQLGVEGKFLQLSDIQTLPVDDDGYPYQPIPKYLKALKGVKLRSGVCGDVHTLVLSEGGEVYSFGGGSFGQLGLGAINKMPLDSDNYPYMPVPTKIEALQDIVIIGISCGDSHSMAVDKEGRLYAWGAAACGQLGFDNLSYLPKDGEGNPYEPEPKFVSFFENIKVISTACGETHSLVLVEGNVIYR
jgi:E3 ubiquitin-protein ligase HERC4